MEVSGARLFVDTDVADAVDDKSLDIAFTHDGEVIFALNDRPYSVAARPTVRARWGRHLRSRRGP
jgi:hypothetical protein